MMFKAFLQDIWIEIELGLCYFNSCCHKRFIKSVSSNFFSIIVKKKSSKKKPYDYRVSQYELIKLAKNSKSVL